MTTVPQTQKALFLSSLGGDFVVGSRHIDKPGPGELLVKVHAASLNPGDWKIQRIETAGKMVDGYPWVGGWDGSGEVVEVGGERELNAKEGQGGTFEKGNRVMFQCVEFKSRYGAYQQYVIVKVGCVAKIPANISYDEAATIPLVLATAYGALRHVNPWGFGVLDKDVVKGEPLVVIGGATGVGQILIQLASHIGFSPIIATSSLKHTQHLLHIGATHVVDRNLSNEEVKERVQAIVGSSPVRYAYDAVGDEATRELGLALLQQGTSTKPTQLGCVDPFVATPLGDAHQRSDGKRLNAFIAVFNEGVEGMPDNKAMFEELNERVGGWLEGGIVKPLRFEVLPGGLEGVVEGIKRLERGEVSGVKLVGRPQETE